ncbi:MAG: response regulator [Lachnospiraceae bacterium]|nr:response regulator [Lachnospiraceae bacterium]
MKKKFILVDDNPTNLTACELALKGKYDIFPVNSATDMFVLLEKMIPDLILLDVEMPIMTGYEAAKILKKNSKYKDIPLIFLTAKDDLESELEGLNLGAFDYIKKPIIKTLILRRIETVLSLIDVQKKLTISNESISNLLEMKTNEVALRRAAEENAIKASMAKGEFLSRMSHEIRTPLNAIIGMIEIASRTDDKDKIRICLKKADSASKQLLSLVNDILDISKIEEGKLELAKNEFSFRKMINNVINVVKIKADEKNIDLAVNLSDNISPYFSTDELRLSQVITNLLANAVKFTPEKGRVEINAAEICDNGDSAVLRVEIADNGIGIEKKQQENLFQPFEQANNNISQKFGGTGLGLAISKQIVEMMDGKIWVESDYNQGAKFIFTINIEKSDGNSFNDGFNDPNGEQYDFSQNTILVAEDVEINREIIQAILEETKIIIDFAENGQEAVDKFTANPDRYDLILMDVQMPVMDGHIATKKIREMEIPRAYDIAIIAMTANVFKEDIEACLNSGMNGHIGKPISIEVLMEILYKWLVLIGR